MIKIINFNRKGLYSKFLTGKEISRSTNICLTMNTLFHLNKCFCHTNKIYIVSQNYLIVSATNKILFLSSQKATSPENQGIFFQSIIYHSEQFVYRNLKIYTRLGANKQNVHNCQICLLNSQYLLEEQFMIISVNCNDVKIYFFYYLCWKDRTCRSDGLNGSESHTGLNGRALLLRISVHFKI
ncbi:hypothetical protein BpHYR1_004666 [Brachionus plicatilis]|uniref:Uncharacterized protein n=1 Tax=Brachionus plicatilis TaxID=10195 RepID=A0A3M7SIV4_BRAPC|nr:hypothetical protein BpHYR1_004666 [Brachionus plicatilis]